MHFNPCAPYGARRIDVAGPILGTEISIHAPLTGRDLSRLSSSAARGISIHAPLTGRDQNRSDKLEQYREFQSTRPLRGATPGFGLQLLKPYISIHAPLTGRDHPWGDMCCFPFLFQSTRPLRGATAGLPLVHPPGQNFNPRAPYGARRWPRPTWHFASNFNPRAPYGARRFHSGITVGSGINFNPRAPYGARHKVLEPLAVWTVFQSTRPLRGATRASCFFALAA